MKNKQSDNILDLIPVRNDKIGWKKAEDNMVVLEIENKGFFNFLAQKLFKKPRVSFVHLDENGSFIWPLLDGQTNVFAIGEKVKERFGEKAEPLYERLAKFLKILESYDFISFKRL